MVLTSDNCVSIFCIIVKFKRLSTMDDLEYDLTLLRVLNECPAEVFYVAQHKNVSNAIAMYVLTYDKLRSFIILYKSIIDFVDTLSVKHLK
jgi:hypothetical protein